MPSASTFEIESKIVIKHFIGQEIGQSGAWLHFQTQGQTYCKLPVG